MRAGRTPCLHPTKRTRLTGCRSCSSASTSARATPSPTRRPCSTSARCPSRCSTQPTTPSSSRPQGAMPLWPTIVVRAVFAADTDVNRSVPRSAPSPGLDPLLVAEKAHSNLSRTAPGSASGSRTSSRCDSVGGCGCVPADNGRIQRAPEPTWTRSCWNSIRGSPLAPGRTRRPPSVWNGSIRARSPVQGRRHAVARRSRRHRLRLWLGNPRHCCAATGCEPRRGDGHRPASAAGHARERRTQRGAAASST